MFRDFLTLGALYLLYDDAAKHGWAALFVWWNLTGVLRIAL